MPFTIPASGKTAGSSIGCTTDLNSTYDALRTVAGFNAQSAAYAGGAVGNGVADDTAALTAWIGAVNTATTGRAVLPPGQYMISSPLPDITASATIIEGGGWAQTASTKGSVITAAAGFSGAQMMSVSGEGVMLRNLTLDAANHVATNLVVTGGKIILHYMQVRGNQSGGVGIDLQSGANSAYLHTVNINGINGGTGLQVAGLDMIMTACKPQNSTVNVVLLGGSNGALLEANHWTPGSSSQTCVQVNGAVSNIALIGNRFDNYVRSALQFTPSTSTPQNVLVASNIFKSTVSTDATYALIGVDTSAFGIRDLHIVGNVAYAQAANRPLYFLYAQTAAGAAATNPTRLSTNGTVCNSNGCWASSAFYGTSSNPTVGRGNMLTTDGTTYAAVTDV